MSRIIDYRLRSIVFDVLKDSEHALPFVLIQARVSASNWNIRMALNYLIEAGIVSKRGKSGIPCEYALTGRAFESGRPKGFDAGELARVWG